jgi:ribosomal protein S24E
LKVYELIKKLAEEDGESEVVISIDYFGGDYGEYNCEKRATIENMYREKLNFENMFILNGTEM